MKKPDIPYSDSAILRRKAEDLLSVMKQDKLSLPTESDALKLIHELQVYQIELEMQNKELARTKEEAAAIANEKYIELYDFAPSGYFSLNKEGKIIDLNLCGAAMLGGKRSQLKSISFTSYVTDDTKPGFRNFLRKVLSSTEIATCELALSVKGKLKSNVFLTGKAIPNEGQCLINAVDITDRKRAEDALHEENSRLELAMQAANMAWWEMDIISGNLTFGERIANMLGFPPEKFKHYTDFMALVHPDDLEKARKAMYDYTKGVKEKHEVEYRILNSSDEYLWFYDIGSVTKRDSVGKPLSAAGLVINITDRKQADETLRVGDMRHRAILLTAMDGFWLADMNGQLLEVNETYCRMSGYSKEELITMHITDFEANESAEETAKHIHIVKSEGETRFESRHRRKDGSILYVEVSVQFQQAEGGRMVAFLRDVTERKKAEQKLLRALERAEESDRLKTAFLANISHEIRTPMNGILGFTELLKTPDLSGEQQQDYIRIIKKSSDRMLNTINNIVDISKIESGQMTILLAETNINEQIEFIYNLFKLEAQNRGLTLFYHTGLHKDMAVIKTDRQKIYAILTSLLSNAIKFTQKGGVEFGCDLTEESINAKHLQFYVKDTGIGIPSDRIKAIFERFMQADISNRRAFQGAGLGLSISRAYIEMLGGRIWVESEPGKGSSFYFTIPYNTVQVGEPIIGNSHSDEMHADNIKMLKILIADDDDISELLISTTYKPYSKKIIKVHTGDDAIEVCRNQPDVNLVMMDIKMPGIDGYEATRQIRKFNKAVVIIAQTAFGLTGDNEKAIEAGCTDYISKPLSVELLKALIQKHFYNKDVAL